MKKVLSAGAALALSLVVAACGGGSSGDDGGATAEQGSSKPYPELVWAGGPLRRMDLTTALDIPTASIEAQVAQTLVTYDKNGKVIPYLAESVETPDDTTYVYRIRQGVRFSDGRPLTIEDVVWSLKRNMGRDAQTASSYANVKSIEAQGDDAVVIKLKTPDVTWPNIPAFAGQIIQKAAALAGGEDKIGTPSNLPVGSGPYRFQSFSPDTGVVLVPNPHWTGTKPSAQKVTFKFLKDASAMTLALRSGDVDGTFEVASKREMETVPGVNVQQAPGAGQIVLSMNTIVEPFDDVHVRRAIAYATDREGLVQAIYGGDATINEGIAPASVFGNIAPADEVDAMFAGLPRYDYDIEKAKAEMAQSRHPEGFTMSVAASANNARAPRVAQAMTPDLAKIGIKVKIDEMTDNEWLALLYGPRDKLGFMPVEYSSTFPDPNALMSYWLDPAAAAVNGLNSANYRNAEMGRLLVAQRQESDGAKRLALIGDAFRLMKEDVPYVPLYTPNVYMALSDKFVMSDYSVWTTYYTAWTLNVRQAS